MLSQPRPCRFSSCPERELIIKISEYCRGSTRYGRPLLLYRSCTIRTELMCPRIGLYHCVRYIENVNGMVLSSVTYRVFVYSHKCMQSDVTIICYTCPAVNLSQRPWRTAIYMCILMSTVQWKTSTTVKQLLLRHLIH